MSEQKKTRNRFGSFFKRLSKLGGMNIMEKDSIARFINETEADKIAELIRDAQSSINREIRFRIHQPLSNFTKFEQNNIIVSLTNEEEKHSTEIFEPFIAKGYNITPLAEYEPFSGYNVYVVSWK